MLDFGFYNMDCLEGMRQFPDNYFELAVVDPPYGIGYDTIAEKAGGTRSKNAAAAKKYYHAGNWDSSTPGDDYFNELFRVSKNQIIWGGNYYKQLPPSKGFICWDKRCSDNIRNNFADCELAWLSEELGVARMYRFVWAGMIQGDMSNKEARIHPTQKPVALYKWILRNYAKPGDKILDTHVGSASSLIACYDLGFDYVGFEIDEEYYKLASKRLEEVKAQIRFEDLF